MLSGGACVAIYANGLYVTKDIDLIRTGLATRPQIEKAMREIGFARDGRHFVHPDSEITVEFPAGPPAIGEEPIRETIIMKFSTGLLPIISPTDSVKDRLSWYYYDNDLQALEQAVLIAQSHDIDLKEIARWSKAEGKRTQFEAIKSRLK